MIEHIIPINIKNITLVRYIARAWPLIPGHVIRDAFKKRDIKVNGTRVDSNFKLNGGEVIQLYIDGTKYIESLQTAFDDGKLIVAVKPQGLPVDIDQDGIGADTLINRIRDVYPGAKLVNRLDAPTGGLVVAATDSTIYNALNNAFREHRIIKKYEALQVECMKRTLMR